LPVYKEKNEAERIEEMMSRRARSRMIVFMAATATLSGCAIGVKSTPGMKLYSKGLVAEAIPMLQSEVAAGQATARYPLGLAYRDGNGVPKNADRAEILLTGAAISGDPRAVSAVRQLLKQASRCPGDAELSGLWGNVGLAYRNLVTGVVELNTAAPGLLRKMASLYDQPCAGAPAQPEAAKSLRALSGGPRHIWIYVPG
jgi:TPR repeat protein